MLAAVDGQRGAGDEVGVIGREERDRRCGQHPHIEDIDTRGGQTGDHGRRQELPRRPRVAPDDGLRFAARGPGGLPQDVRGRDSEAEGEVKKKITSDTKAGGRQVRASEDDPQYLVKSEKSGGEAVHKPSALEKE